ncbi:hypothetical protein [Thalassoroseus pseudoceratinae]|uniref:hypothetical protein n=1 Tax=Thalassoroseus pseudoceratinae TaxID=2713176 RepID=UPI00141F0302|nr:hypothetical protein [Thalassoroseus pseudoceratinae]
MRISMAVVVAAIAMIGGIVDSAAAADVTIKGVHLCCGRCVKDVADALDGIEGVSGVSADRNSKVVNFNVKDDKAAKAGVQALADYGFGGNAVHEDKPLAFPSPGIKKNAKGNEVTFEGVHLCCGGCVVGAKKAVQDVEGVAQIAIDREEKTVKLTGSKISFAKAFAALKNGGYFGTLAKE